MTSTGVRVRAAQRAPARRAVLAAIDFYARAISPALPPRCRFYPTCSAYAAEAVELHGAGRGMWLALTRLLKCAPWHPGGTDHVPGSLRGTAPGVRSSSTPEAPTAAPDDDAVARGAPSTQPATPPATRRAPTEESFLA